MDSLAETFAKFPKSPKCLGGNLGDFGNFAKVSGRLKNNFQTASLYQKRPALSKIEVQAAFCDDWKKHTLFLYCILCRHTAKQTTQRNSHV